MGSMATAKLDAPGGDAHIVGQDRRPARQGMLNRLLARHDLRRQTESTGRTYYRMNKGAGYLAVPLRLSFDSRQPRATLAVAQSLASRVAP